MTGLLGMDPQHREVNWSFSKPKICKWLAKYKPLGIKTANMILNLPQVPKTLFPPHHQITKEPIALTAHPTKSHLASNFHQVITIAKIYLRLYRGLQLTLYPIHYTQLSRVSQRLFLQVPHQQIKLIETRSSSKV